MKCLDQSHIGEEVGGPKLYPGLSPGPPQACCLFPHVRPDLSSGLPRALVLPLNRPFPLLFHEAPSDPPHPLLIPAAVPLLLAPSLPSCSCLHSIRSATGLIFLSGFHYASLLLRKRLASCYWIKSIYLYLMVNSLTIRTYLPVHINTDVFI